jgi:hypothetical protein
MKYRIVLLFILALLIAAPAFAQEGDTLTVSTGGIQVTIDKDFATGVSVNAIPADPAEFGPGFAEPASTQIAFSNPAPGFAAESILTIRLYPISGFAEYPEHLNRLAQLQNILANQSPLTEYMTYQENAMTNVLPFIPVYPHGQVAAARAEYVETPIMRGVRFVAAFSADLSPFTSNSFVYTYQGITRDEQVYVSAQAFVTTDVFPAELEGFDPAEFQATLPQYMDDSIAALNAADASSFSPALDDVDTIMQSLTVTPMQ